MEIFCRNLLSCGLDLELLSPTKLSQEEASTKVRCARRVSSGPLALDAEAGAVKVKPAHEGECERSFEDSNPAGCMPHAVRSRPDSGHQLRRAGRRRRGELFGRGGE